MLTQMTTDSLLVLTQCDTYYSKYEISSSFLILRYQVLKVYKIWPLLISTITKASFSHVVYLQTKYDICSASFLELIIFTRFSQLEPCLPFDIHPKNIGYNQYDSHTYQILHFPSFPSRDSVFEARCHTAHTSINA